MSAPPTLEPKWFSEHELKLVRGTYDAMVRSGTQQLTLRGLAKELGVSPTLLTYHFGSKDELLVETMHWALSVTVRRLQQRIADVDDAEQALAALMDELFLDARANRDFHLIYLDLVQYAVRQESFTQLTALLHEHVHASYAMVIAQGVESGVFAVADVDEAAQQARAIVEGGFVQWLQRPDWEPAHADLKRRCHAGVLRLLAVR